MYLRDLATIEMEEAKGHQAAHTLWSFCCGVRMVEEVRSRWYVTWIASAGYLWTLQILLRLDLAAADVVVKESHRIQRGRVHIYRQHDRSTDGAVAAHHGFCESFGL